MKTLLKLFSLKFIASLLGLVYSIIQVRYFGASRSIEVFFAAQTMVYLVTSLTQSGKLAEIFLPVYHDLEYKQKGLGFNGLNVVINRMLIFGTGVIAVVFILTPYIVALMVPGFSASDQDKVSLMFRLLLPYLVIQIMNSFYIIILNAEEKFTRTELLGTINSMVNIISLVLLYPYIHVWALIVSLLTGKFIEFTFYIILLYRMGYRYRMITSHKEFEHKNFFSALLGTFTYVSATQLYSMVLTASISFLPEGTYAIFKYVQNLASKIRGLFIQPFLVLFFTYYSKLLRKSQSLIKEFNKNISGILQINTVLIIGSILLGDYIIDLIWGSKKFDSSDVKLAYIFLLFNLVGILISGISSIYRKMAVAHHRGKELYYFWSIAQLVSAGFTYLAIKYYHIQGLYFIVPVNALLLGMVSYIIYIKTENAITYKFINKNNLILIFLILCSVFFKYFIQHSLPLKKSQILSIFVFLTLILIAYPLINVYKLFKR